MSTCQTTSALASSGLVQIRRSASSTSWWARAARGPVVDKFFVLGAVASYLGMAGFGMHLWLMLNGRMVASEHYLFFREYHAQIQLHLFFGLFVLGFLTQAGPKLFGVEGTKHGHMLLVPLLLVSGVVVQWWPWGKAFGHLVVASGYLVALRFLFVLARTSESPRRIELIPMLTLSLTTFLVSPFANVSSPTFAALFFWLALAAPLFVASRQFVVGFLGGPKPTPVDIIGGTALYLTSAVLMLIAFVNEGWTWNLAGGGAVLTSLFFFTRFRLWQAPVGFTPLALGMRAGYLWAVIGSAVLLWRGGEASDLVFHIWATGWGVTAVLMVSMQILGFLSGRAVLPDWAQLSLLAVWQLVPFGRGVLSPSALRQALSIPVSIAVTVVLTAWVGALLVTEWRMVRRQLDKTQGPPLQC